MLKDKIITAHVPPGYHMTAKLFRTFPKMKMDQNIFKIIFACLLGLKRRSSSVFIETREPLDRYYAFQNYGALNYPDAFDLLFFKLSKENSPVSFRCDNCVYIGIEKKNAKKQHIYRYAVLKYLKR